MTSQHVEDLLERRKALPQLTVVSESDLQWYFVDAIHSSDRWAMANSRSELSSLATVSSISPFISIGGLFSGGLHDIRLTDFDGQSLKMLANAYH